jgi:hypothetical protein
MMKKYILTAILAGLLLLAAFLLGCARAGSSMNGSGKIIDQDINISGFTRVTASGNMVLEMVQAESFKVTVSTDDNLINRLLFELEEETLKIAVQAPANFFPTSLKIRIEMPRLYALDISGGTQAVTAGFKSTFNFDLQASDSSSLNGILDAGNCIFNIAGHSRITLKGSALSLELNASGASHLDLTDFVLNSAQVYLKEDSEADLNINGLTDVKLEGGSRIYYLGNPKFSNTSISGGSFMQHK